MTGMNAAHDIRALGLLGRRLPALQSFMLDAYCYLEEAADPLEAALRCAHACARHMGISLAAATLVRV